MLFIIFVCAALALIWTGVGLLFFSPEKMDRIPFRMLLNTFWVGWALGIAFLQIWHLFFPVGAAAFLFILAAGFAGWFRARAAAWRQIKNWGIGRIALVTGLALVPLIVLSSHVLYSSPHYDHGLYHNQTVQWLNHYAIVPGLGNLHHRLAFNNSNFLYSAVINWGPFAERAYYLSTTLLSFLLLLACADGFYQLFQPGTGRRVSNMFYAWMLPVSLWQFSSQSFAGYSPDIVVFILQVVISGIFLELFESEDQAEANRKLRFLVLLAAAGMTVKASFFVFSTAAILLALLAARRRYGSESGPGKINFLQAAGLAALFIVPWMLRNIILSGYPFFPSAILGMPVPWRMPEALIRPIAPTITNWARTMSQTIPYTGDLNWLLQWWKLFPFIPVQRAFLASILLFAGNAGLVIWLRKKKPFPWGIALLFGINALSVLFWFGMAPDYRFSGASIWLLLVCTLLFALSLLVEDGLVQPLFGAVVVLLVLTLWLQPNQFIIRRPAASQVLVPMPERALLEMRYPPGPFETRTTNTGLAVHMPVEPADQCWYAELPCTRPQDFLERLRLIDPGKMQKGFMIQ